MHHLAGVLSFFFRSITVHNTLCGGPVCIVRINSTSNTRIWSNGSHVLGLGMAGMVDRCLQWWHHCPTYPEGPVFDIHLRFFLVLLVMERRLFFLPFPASLQ